MATNISSKAQTLQEEIAAMGSDTWSAGKFILYGDYLGESVVPDGNVLDDYYDYFQQYLVEEDLPEEFHYKPAMFAYNRYGVAELDFLVMYFAQIPSVLEFNKKKIKVLPIQYLFEINEIAIKYKKKVTDSYNNPTKYEVMDSLSDYKKNYL